MSTLNTTNLKHPDSTDNNIVLSAGGGITVSSLNGRVPVGALGTMVNAAGTNVDWLDIPSTARKLTLFVSNVKSNITCDILVRLGSGSFDASSTYIGSNSFISTSTVASIDTTTGLSFINRGSNTSTIIHGGAVVVELMDPATNLWNMSSQLYNTDIARTCFGTCRKALSGVLDRIQVTTSNTAVLATGTLNLMIE